VVLTFIFCVNVRCTMQVATHMASTPQLGGPVACPICGLIAVDRIFRDFSMTAEESARRENCV
jgi:hypothetical protein